MFNIYILTDIFIYIIWRYLQNNKNSKIYSKSETGKPINTPITFSPSMTNHNVLVTIQQVLNASSQRRGSSINLAIICNHVDK